MHKAQGTVNKPKLKCSMSARSGDAIKVSARNGQSYTDILKEMKAKVDPRRAGLKVLSIRKTRKEEVLLVLENGERFRPNARSSTRRLGRGRKFWPWS